MMKTYIKILLIAFGLITFPVVGWTVEKSFSAPSLEWMAASSPLIVRGRIVEVKKFIMTI